MIMKSDLFCGFQSSYGIQTKYILGLYSTMMIHLMIRQTLNKTLSHREEKTAEKVLVLVLPNTGRVWDSALLSGAGSDKEREQDSEPRGVATRLSYTRLIPELRVK